MNEEEIIEKAKDFAKRGVDPVDYIDDLIMQETMQGLLDLYAQEKEKNKELLKEYNKELLKEYNKKINADWEDAISKDKIRAKIEELEQEQKEYKDGREWEIQDDIDAQIIILEELLEQR